MARRQTFSYDRLEGTRPRVVRFAVGVALVVLVAITLLAPVLGLVGSAAAVGPLIDVPWLGLTAGVVLGLLVSIGCLAVTFRSRRASTGWVFVALAVLFAVAASVWPLLATADAAVDRARDVLPWITELVREFG